MKGLLYQRVSAYAEKTGQSRSEIVEKALDGFLDGVGQPKETVLRPRPPKPEKKAEVLELPNDGTGPACFTF